MKILYHHRIASKDGQYVHVESIIRELRKKGHEVIIVAPSVAENTEFGSDGGWVTSIRQNLPQAFSEILEFGYNFYAFFKLLVAVVKHKPDVIYERYNLFLTAGIWIKQVFRLPFQLEVNSPLYNERLEYGGLALKRLAQWSEHYTWKNADRVLPVTEVLAKYLYSASVDKQSVKVIPNGIDLELFPPKQVNNRYERYQNKLVIGFVGFCREWHKLDQVLRALAANQRADLFFLIVGDGPVINELKVLAKDLHFEDNFECVGLVDRQNMTNWLDQIDIAIQPAVTPWASPLKVIEYLVKGLAIVAPNTPNINELLTDSKNALLFDVDNIADMVHKIIMLIENNELRTKLQLNARATIDQKELYWSQNADKIITYFESRLADK